MVCLEAADWDVSRTIANNSPEWPEICDDNCGLVTNPHLFLNMRRWQKEEAFRCRDWDIYGQSKTRFSEVVRRVKWQHVVLS